MAELAKDETAAPSAAKQALVELRRMRAKLDAAERQRSEPLAICGMGMRFPGGVVDAASYWRLLRDGVDAITEIPASRWNVDEYYDPDPATPGKMYSRHGGFVSAIEDFDAEFFGLSPREAEYTDPQQRLLLEVAWEALENAAIAPNGLARTRSGVFLGIGNSDYGRLLVREPASIDAHTGTGSAICVAAGRLSYALGLSGPSMVVDTACSSSLTAVSLACESLRRGECDIALAGGSSLILTPEFNIAFCKARMLAPDGRCKTFDARADGYVRGEGCAIVVLKRLSDALRDDDPVLAVVRGFAVNQDGASSGLTVPNGPAQEAVIRDALRNGGVEPTEVDYVEAHGTATSLGDPIEVHALGAVFGKRPPGRPLRIGSVKTNIGHLEAAAGIAGIIKVVLALRHGRLPPTLHLRELSPRIDWSRCAVTVPTELTEWSGEGTRTAGVSAFGFSGTNAHVVLGEAPRREYRALPARPAEVVTLSAAEPAALAPLAAAYAAELADDAVSLAEFAWTAQTGRSHLRHRAALVASDAREMRERLREFAATGTAPGCCTGQWFDSEPPPVTFLFGGHGAGLSGTSRASYDRHPVFRRALDECNALLEEVRGGSLLEVLHGRAADAPLPAHVAQPASVALQYAQVKLWQSWGVQPAAVCGIGMGEYAAACVAGVYDIAAALALAAARGRLYDAATPLSLLDVPVAADTLRARLDRAGEELFIAAENGPASTVVAGDAAAIDSLALRLVADGIEAARLGTAHIGLPGAGRERSEFARIAQSIEFREPQIVVVSARDAGTDLASADAWIAECGSGTRLWPAIEALREDGQRIFFEFGPRPVLLPLARRALPDADCCWLAAGSRDRDDDVLVPENLATLYAQGLNPAWRTTREPGTRRVALPTYPFQRERHWWQGHGNTAANDLPGRRWEFAVAAGRLQAGLVPMDMRIGDYADKWRTLAELTDGYIVAAFCTLGLFQAAGETHTPDSLLARGGIKPVYRMLMSRWLNYLAAAGRLERQGERYTAPAPLPAPDLRALEDTARRTLADIPQLLAYVERCGALLTDVLTDRESALQTLFPGGSTETARFLYRDWAVPRYFNQIAASVVERFVTLLPAGRPARLLEIGAGTGATTSSVLPRLAGRDLGYFFTDVSDYFLAQASEAFGEYDFVQYGLLDIGRNPAEQGYGMHGFDVVIAANVLHATDNLEDTVDHVLSLLAPGGMLVLYETTDAPRWSDISVSLIEGWQSFKDAQRTDHPLLPAGRWKELLLARGFDDVVNLPDAGSPAAALGSHIIVAQVAANRAVTVGAADVAVFAPAPAVPAPAAQEGGKADALRRAVGEAAANEREALLIDYVRAGVNRVLRRDPGKALDRRQRLMDLGVDSLMAVELRNVLTTGLALEEPLPATLIFDHPTIEAVAAYLDLRLAGPADAQGTAEPDSAQRAARGAMSAEDVDALSDDEVKAALRARIGEG